MALKPPEDGWVWVQVPLDTAIDLVVVGEAETWYSHWYRAPGQKRADALRCVLDEHGSCELCRAGYDRRVRYVLPVEYEGQLRLVEFGRVQYPALCCITEFHGLVGSRIRVTRERPVRNAPIQLRWVSSEVVAADRRQDISGYVATIGGLQLRLLGEDALRAVEGPALRVVSGGGGRR